MSASIELRGTLASERRNLCRIVTCKLVLCSSHAFPVHWEALPGCQEFPKPGEVDALWLDYPLKFPLHRLAMRL